MIPTRLHDELEAEVARLPDDATVTMTARAARELVAEALGIEDQAIADWIDLVDPPLVVPR